MYEVLKLGLDYRRTSSKASATDIMPAKTESVLAMRIDGLSNSIYSEKSI